MADGSPHHFFDLTPDDLRPIVEDLGLPAFTAKQVQEWVYRRGVTDPAAMTNLPAAGRAALAERLVFEFRARSFEPGQVTEVEVRFEGVDLEGVDREGVGQGTRVTVEHRGWDALGAGHPVRHGLAGTAFTDMMGVWWGDLLAALRRAAAAPAGRGGA